ncbi:DNA mismatch repair protein MutS [Maribacter sp. R77961]|uniref:MutS-related protein n=1 Tax=Maribacter sp. R77961 TaxID=3093871 RepID=UPI0037C702EF
MQDLIGFYQNKIEKFTAERSKRQKELWASSMLRLAVFVSALLGSYVFRGNIKLVVAIILATIIIFLFLVSRHTDLQRKRDRLKALININEIEIKVLQRDFHHLPSGEEYKDSTHYYSQDIDLFGMGSFYQYMNRTTLKQGGDMLSEILKENTIDAIVQKQKAIAELAKKPNWRQEFSATASLVKTDTPTSVIINWLKGYISFVPKVMRFLPLLFSGVSILLFVLYFMNSLAESILIYWIVFGLLITGIYARKVARLGANSGKLLAVFQQYTKLLSLIEEQEFSADFLKKKKEQILNDGRKTSEILKEFSNLLNSLDRNNNIIYLIFGNGLFLMGLSTCFKIEKWITAYGASVNLWFNTIAFYDAYCSLGNFAFNHPDYTFPKIIKEGNTITSEQAGHPLLAPEKSIRNDFEIKKDEFFIITGANMAGKSTFLRTVSLQLLMANIGLPVCAKSVSYKPIKLITSMRTTDSLTDDESYFFSELKRLKFIVEEIQKDPYFIVLDEILKGTNSTDKAKGSRKFIERLVASNATGIIATHDLSLCEVAKELPQVKNYYFDAEIIANELHFDYRFKEGVCQNMNASFLLRKMEII